MQSLIRDHSLHLRSGGSSFLSSTPSLMVGLTRRTKRWKQPSAAWSSRAHLPGGWSLPTIIDQLCDRPVHLPVCLQLSTTTRLRKGGCLSSLGLSSFCTWAAVTPPGPTSHFCPHQGGQKVWLSSGDIAPRLNHCNWHLNSSFTI